MKGIWRNFKRLKIPVLGQDGQINNIVTNSGAASWANVIFLKNTERNIVNAEIGIVRDVDPGCFDFILPC
jgi:hypothetical protein